MYSTIEDAWGSNTLYDSSLPNNNRTNTSIMQNQMFNAMNSVDFNPYDSFLHYPQNQEVSFQNHNNDNNDTNGRDTNGRDNNGRDTKGRDTKGIGDINHPDPLDTSSSSNVGNENQTHKQKQLEVVQEKKTIEHFDIGNNHVKTNNQSNNFSGGNDKNININDLINQVNNLSNDEVIRKIHSITLNKLNKTNKCVDINLKESLNLVKVFLIGMIIILCIQLFN